MHASPTPAQSLSIKTLRCFRALICVNWVLCTPRLNCTGSLSGRKQYRWIDNPTVSGDTLASYQVLRPSPPGSTGGFNKAILTSTPQYMTSSKGSVRRTSRKESKFPSHLANSAGCGSHGNCVPIRGIRGNPLCLRPGVWDKAPGNLLADTRTCSQLPTFAGDKGKERAKAAPSPSECVRLKLRWAI